MLCRDIERAKIWPQFDPDMRLSCYLSLDENEVNSPRNYCQSIKEYFIRLSWHHRDVPTLYQAMIEVERKKCYLVFGVFA